jgi:hypothetical protein
LSRNFGFRFVMEIVIVVPGEQGRRKNAFGFMQAL